MSPIDTCQVIYKGRMCILYILNRYLLPNHNFARSLEIIIKSEIAVHTKHNCQLLSELKCLDYSTSGLVFCFLFHNDLICQFLEAQLNINTSNTLRVGIKQPTLVSIKVSSNDV